MSACKNEKKNTIVFTTNTEDVLSMQNSVCVGGGGTVWYSNASIENRFRSIVPSLLCRNSDNFLTVNVLNLEQSSYPFNLTNNNNNNNYFSVAWLGSWIVFINTFFLPSSWPQSNLASRERRIHLSSAWAGLAQPGPCTCWAGLHKKIFGLVEF